MPVEECSIVDAISLEASSIDVDVEIKLSNPRDAFSVIITTDSIQNILEDMPDKFFALSQCLAAFNDL